MSQAMRGGSGTPDKSLVAFSPSNERGVSPCLLTGLFGGHTNRRGGSLAVLGVPRCAGGSDGHPDPQIFAALLGGRFQRGSRRRHPAAHPVPAGPRGSQLCRSRDAKPRVRGGGSPPVWQARGRGARPRRPRGRRCGVKGRGERALGPAGGRRSPRRAALTGERGPRLHRPVRDPPGSGVPWRPQLGCAAPRSVGSAPRPRGALPGGSRPRGGPGPGGPGP